MLTPGDSVRLILATGTLEERGLLVQVEDPEFTTVRVAGRQYRYHPRFWQLTGVLEDDGGRQRLRLQGPESERARRRVAEEWISAGAPGHWARTEADAAVLSLVVRPETVGLGAPGQAAAPDRRSECA